MCIIIIYIYIYVYAQRSPPRRGARRPWRSCEARRDMYIYIYIHTQIYIYIYI